jgi:hypothetical protein
MLLFGNVMCAFSLAIYIISVYSRGVVVQQRGQLRDFGKWGEKLPFTGTLFA